MKAEDIKRIDIAEFRKEGYLQELNRRFLHPLGLALEVVIDEETKKEKLGGIWDSRDDEEGIHYDIANSDQDRKNRFKKNFEDIERSLDLRKESRMKALGYFIEPALEFEDQIEHEVLTEIIAKYPGVEIVGNKKLEDETKELIKKKIREKVKKA